MGEFNACAVSQKQCVPRRSDDGSWPVPEATSLVKSFDTSKFEGRWYISAGLNPTFDTFDCQVHFFTSGEPGEVFGKLNWRIREPDGEFFTRDTIQRFVQSTTQPALLENHNNDYLHYQDDWYILDADPGATEDAAFVLVYYRGTNDAWDGYGGSVLYTKAPAVPSGIRDRVSAACARAGLDFSKFKENDNSCKPGSYNPTLLREQYASKLLLLAEKDVEKAIAAEATTIRSAAVQQTAPIANSLVAVEETLAGYERKLIREISTVEKIVEQDVTLLENIVERDIELALRLATKAP